MFATYVYKAGATGANILADVLKLIADGSIASLSADAVQASCTRAGVATGWTLDDAGYGIVSAPFEDGLARKVFKLSQSGNVLRMAGLDSWNAATHVGVNVCADQSMSALPVSTGGSLGIIACPEVLAIWDTNGYFLVGAEFPRVEPFFIGRAATAVLRFLSSSDFTAHVTRVKSCYAVGDVVNSQLTLVGNVPMNGSLRGNNELPVYLITPLYVQIWASGYSGAFSPPFRGVALVPYMGAPGTIFTGADGDFAMLPYTPSYQRAIGVLRK